METITLYHGSRCQIDTPQFGCGSPYNDYGLGFYCTQSYDLAAEWACGDESGGYVNEYTLSLDELEIINLDAEPFTSLNWLATLVENRKFAASVPLMAAMKDFLISKYAVDLSGADLVCGYRADDSYFSFARAFLNNRISVRQLERALLLGKLGRQTVLKSPRSFDAIKFIRASRVDGAVWYPKRAMRDRLAREEYELLMEEDFSMDDVFALDLMRAER